MEVIQMEKKTQIRLIINPAGVEKAQLLAEGEKGRKAGLELYQKLQKEIYGFSKRVEKILKRSEN
jgi:hypothetical protein